MSLLIGSFNRAVGNLSGKVKLLLSVHIRALRVVPIGKMAKGIEFTKEQLEEMVRNYQKGASSKELAREFVVSRGTILDRLRKNSCEIRKNRVKFTQKQLEEIVEKYEEGVSSAKLAERFGVSQSTILDRLRKSSCEVRPLKYKKANFSKEEIHEMAKNYRQGDTASKLAEDFGVSDTTILRWLKESGCEIRPGGPYVKRDIPKPWNDVNAAYVFGVLTSDASVEYRYRSEERKGPIGIALNTPDRGFMATFSEAVESAFGIQATNSGRRNATGTRAYSVDLGRAYDEFKWRKQTWRIPEPFFEASRKIKISFCQGKLDSDGWPVKKWGAAEIASINKPGLEDLLVVIESLNFETTFNGPYYRENPNRKDEWKLRISNASPELFKLPRKKKYFRKQTAEDLLK